jgi:hypothetical protein
MAKRRTSTAIVRAVPVRAPAPVIRIAAPRPVQPKKPTRRRRHHSSGGGRGIVATAIGGAVLGFVERTFPSLPTLPIVGRAGTVAIAAHFIGRHMSGGVATIARDVSIAAAAIAGYQLGKTGKIEGDDVMGDIVPQVSGIASQV